MSPPAASPSASRSCANGVPPNRTVSATLWRGLGLAAGVATHVLFAYTVWRLYGFLSNAPARPGSAALMTDALLSLQFAVPHSLLLLPSARRLLCRWISPPFYGLFFCAMTCLNLLITIMFWRTTSQVIWDFSGVGRWLMQGGFVLSWGALLYSLYISGIGYQTGLTPWLEWVRRRPPAPRRFHEIGWYRWFRHPIYLSFLGLIWFTPRMSLDHAVLTGLWTLYIFCGSWLKDRRLEYYAGDRYREYESRVPGFPGMMIGPLGLRGNRSISNTS